MSQAVSAPLIAVHPLAASIWIGGLVALFVVARVASKTLEPSQRVAFFRALDRSYGILGCVALLVALASGAALLHGHPWDGLLIAIAIVAGALLIATAVGMAQARAMTRLRRQALAGDDAAAARVRRAARVDRPLHAGPRRARCRPGALAGRASGSQITHPPSPR